MTRGFSASNALHGQTQLECARPTRIGFAALAALLLAAPTALASGAALTAEVDTLAGVEYHVTRKFGSFRFLRVDAPTRRQRGAIPLSRLLAAASEVIPDLERRLGLVARGEHFVLDSLYVNYDNGSEPGWSPRFRQMRDDIVLGVGRATFGFDVEGRPYGIDARAEVIAPQPEIRWMSRGEALARATSLLGSKWDGKVYINRKVLVGGRSDDWNAYHEVILGCTHRGWPDTWQVYLATDGSVLMSRYQTKYD